ncbi:hypothetical protein DFH09DRAFT_1209427 [Mycena vulgaris]|nr:hypothetical protein DFH09DRAFT_1209427 [Mycena vulgaris]
MYELLRQLAWLTVSMSSHWAMRLGRIWDPGIEGITCQEHGGEGAESLCPTHIFCIHLAPTRTSGRCSCPPPLPDHREQAEHPGLVCAIPERILVRSLDAAHTAGVTGLRHARLTDAAWVAVGRICCSLPQ